MSISDALQNGQFELNVDNQLVKDGEYAVSNTRSFGGGGDNPMTRPQKTRYTILHDDTGKTYSVIQGEDGYYIASQDATPHDSQRLADLKPGDITPTSFDLSPP